jgi:hypothetical protein
MGSTDFLRRVVHGFAFGLGFAAAAGIGWFVVHEATGMAGEFGGTVSANASAGTPAMPAALPGPASDVRVTGHRVERRNGDTVVLGTLRNDADAAAGSVRVEAAYYDGSGRLVDVCGWYVAQRLAPGEEKPFKISCGGTPEKPTPESASVKLRLVQAF